jgi:hypothetical protein
MKEIRDTAPPNAVRRIMRKHGLSEPTARTIAALAYGEVSTFINTLERVTD